MYKFWTMINSDVFVWLTCEWVDRSLQILKEGCLFTILTLVTWLYMASEMRFQLFHCLKQFDAAMHLAGVWLCDFTPLERLPVVWVLEPLLAFSSSFSFFLTITAIRMGHNLPCFATNPVVLNLSAKYTAQNLRAASRNETQWSGHCLRIIPWPFSCRDRGRTGMQIAWQPGQSSILSWYRK